MVYTFKIPKELAGFKKESLINKQVLIDGKLMTVLGVESFASMNWNNEGMPIGLLVKNAKQRFVRR